MADFAPTVIDAAGGDGSAFGQTYFEVTAADNATRRYYWIRPPTGNLPGILEVFDITGDARDFRNWRQEASITMAVPYQ
jgi:hypothetical protein